MVSGSKKRVIEIADIVTWIEAFTIFSMIFCHTFLSRWKDLNQYKLLVIQTARRFSDKSWLHYALRHRLQKRSRSLRFNRLISHAPGQTSTIFTPDLRLPLQLLQVPQLPLPRHQQSLSGLQATPGLASIATHGTMGAVAGPFVAAGFVTPANRAMGTTPASTALTGPHGENSPAPLLIQRGVTAAARPSLANSAVNNFVSVHVGSHGNFSALELRSPFVLSSPQQGLPSSSYSLCSPAVCPLRPVSQLTPINVDRFQHESVIILTQTKLHTWSKAFAMVFT